MQQGIAKGFINKFSRRRIPTLPQMAQRRSKRDMCKAFLKKRCFSGFGHIGHNRIKKRGGICVRRKLKYFQPVVRRNSFSEAAEENFISQSAISQQIQALERELGFQLLERKNRGFVLTSADEYFYQKSLILTADYDRMCSEVAKIANGDRASLKIGYLRSYTGAEFHRALELFSEKHPDVEVSVAYGNHEELYGLLRTGEAELIFNDQRRAQRLRMALPSTAAA